MKIAKLKLVIGAAITIFLLAGTASADGRRGRDHDRSGPGYHHEYRPHHGPNYRRPTPHRGPRHLGPKYPHGPQYYHGPRHHYGYAYPHTGHRRHQLYRTYVPNSGYGVHLSIFDPYFMFGFSSGGRR